MIRIFAACNGTLLGSLGTGVSPTYTRIHFLLRGLTEYADVEIDAVSCDLPPGRSISRRLANNLRKTLTAIRSAHRIRRDRPWVYFAYPHSMTTVQNRLLFSFCSRTGVRTILDLHDTLEQTGAVGDGNERLSRRREADCLRKASLVVALNRPMWERVSSTYGLNGSRPVVIAPNAFEDAFLHLYPEPYRAARGRFNVCYIGALTRNRGIDLLVDACTAVHAENHDLRLHLYGPYGPGIPAELRDRIEDAEWIVRRELPRTELPAALKGMDVLVMPYNPAEPYLNLASPTKLYEYIGTGIPILCTKCDSLLDAGSNGGILYVDYTADALRDAIVTLHNCPSLREEMSRRLCAIRSDHTWSMRAESVRAGILSSLEREGQE
ncbi:glycosyltransferase family 4 protein [Methanoculleus sp. FWC-SCC1]|uniref:Glycosyltransferase family 4 protein n=1 Tax=Methanoculleus frigidifontis TaxID=2584085 RepID=A0ABT8M7P9_9EURY|nr:glycosyltransferase [Methanoculleus sp. FWC-SCC1]MDN7023950.1 glycosyltransferase family 4 protein [Methanoculleus sp. FWC-SCC1]